MKPTYSKDIAVLLPCLNEEVTIGKVVRDFKKELPKAKVYVYDNLSTDNTSKVARDAGAIVVKAERRGKGNVIKKMFNEIEADIYIMADGDDTYDATKVHELIKPLLNHQADMTVGARLGSFTKENKKLLHTIGNKVILWQVQFCFPSKVSDMLSGYRGFTRDLVQSLNLTSSGFTVETELTIKTLENGFKIKEIPITYRDRPKGSESKLDSFSDGMYILTTVLSLFRDYRPMQFFLLFSIIALSVAAGFGIAVAEELITTGQVTKFDSLIMTVFFLLISFQFFLIGILGSSIHASKVEQLNMLQNIRQLIRRK